MSRIVPAVMFAFVVFCRPAAAAVSDEADKLFEKKQPKKAVKLLRKHLKSREDDDSLKARIRLAEHYDSLEKFKDSLKLLRKYSEFNSLKRKNPDSKLALEAYGERAFATGASGDLYHGLKALAIAADRTKGLESAVVDYYYGKLLHHHAKDREAFKHLRRGRAAAEEYLKKLPPPPKPESASEADKKIEDPSKPERDYWLRLAAKYGLLEEKVELALFALEYGKDYALCKWGRKHQLRGRFRKAAGYFERIIDEFPLSPFAKAAECYRIECLLKDSDLSFAQVRKIADRALKREPYAVYRGEIALTLGEHLLDVYADADAAERYLSRAYDFCERSRRLAENEILFSLSDKVKKIGVVDLPFEAYTSSFQLVRRKVNSGEIVNRETNHHYIDELQKRCAFLLGFVKFAKGDVAKAAKLFAEVGKFDKAMLDVDAKHMPNALARLRGACVQGFFFLNPEELGYFKGKDRVRILLADFHYALEETAKAERIYSDLLSSSEERKRKACLLLRLADCRLAGGEYRRSEALRLEALELARKMKTPLYHALFSLGCFHASQGEREKSYKYLKAAARKGQKTYYGRLAHFKLYNDMALRGDATAARREYRRFCEIYSEPYSEAKAAELGKRGIRLPSEKK